MTVGVNGVPEDVVVPLAHQSVLAGVMLAVQLLVADEPALRAARPAEVEARFDVFRGLPQSPAVPRAKLARCICGDTDFVDAYRARAGGATEVAA